MKIRPCGQRWNGVWRLNVLQCIKNVLWNGSMVLFVLYCLCEITAAATLQLPHVVSIENVLYFKLFTIAY